MKSTVNKLENSQVELIVEVEGDVWTNAQEQSYKNAVKNLEVDGFRKGQVPAAVAKSHIKNEMTMLDAVELVAQEALIAGIDANDIILVATPELQVEAISDTATTLKFICTVKPEVKLGDYKGLDIEVAEVTVTDTEVEEELNSMLDKHAELVSKDGEVVEGDTTVIDFKGFKGDEAFEGGEAENFSLEIGSGQFIPGFEEQLVGLKAGDTKDVELAFPEDYHVEDLKGQDVVFKVTLHEVKERQVPELNDDFALDVDLEEVKNLEDLKNHVRSQIEFNKAAEVARDHENELLSTIVDNAEVEIPEIMVEQETDRLYQDMKMRIEQQGIPFDQFIAMTGQDDSVLRENLAEDALRQVKLRLVLDEISEVEKIEVSDEDLASEYAQLAEQYNMELEAIKEAISKENIEYDLKIRKAYDLVKELN
ncbi:MAG: trigger factor [Erysipelothrix sp.]|nr:trigger factor [Erysipelothrix sp.]